MKTTPIQFEAIRTAAGVGGVVPIDTIVIKNIITDLNALQQYEAAGLVQFKVPLVMAYLADALTQARDLLAMVEQAGDHLKTGGPA